MTLDDLLRQIRFSRRLGSFAGVLRFSPRYIQIDPDENTQSAIERMILAMSPEERRFPDRIGGERISEVSEDSGESQESVVKFLRGFELLRGAA